MYVARGSGLWYDAGRTLVCSDTIDLANYMNDTKYSPRVGDTKPPLFEAAIRVLAGQFESISFAHHSEGALATRAAPRVPG